MRRGWATWRRSAWVVVALVGAFGCADGSESDGAPVDDGDNPFLAAEGNLGKADTQYVNPDGIEVEVDLEADVQAPSYRLLEAPAMLGQFAVTYLRQRGQFYVESLAEDATSKDRVEWLVDGAWTATADLGDTPRETLTHFRIRGVNAVLLHREVDGAAEGKAYLARVPVNPFDLMTTAGDACADPDGHIGLSSSVYWYLWNPDRSGCKPEWQQDMLVTISRMLPARRVTFPEYDQLVADRKVTAVVLFGQIGDGALETDSGTYGFERMARWLTQAGYEEVTPAPVGRRFHKIVTDVDYEIDLYAPRDFSGLSDYAHYGNFERAVTEHEIVAYDGHSMLGASDFWARPQYPDHYQIFLYGGCLGYEYYVRPILDGKGGWDRVDILSSVVEVSAGAQDFAGPFLAKLAFAIEHGYNVSWTDMLVAIRKAVGDSTFGVSGARENCFSPGGSLCGTDAPVAGDVHRFDSAPAADIPDDDETGITSVIDVPDAVVGLAVTVSVSIRHTYIGDLRVTLEHDGTEALLWNNAGGDTDGLSETFAVADFAGKTANGAWTLHVADTQGQDTGTLDAWALEIVYPQ